MTAGDYPACLQNNLNGILGTMIMDDDDVDDVPHSEGTFAFDFSIDHRPI